MRGGKGGVGGSRQREGEDDEDKWREKTNEGETEHCTCFFF